MSKIENPTPVSRTSGMEARRIIGDLVGHARFVEANFNVAYAHLHEAEAFLDTTAPVSDDYQKGFREGLDEALQIATIQAALMADLALEGLPENARDREAMEAALKRFSHKLKVTLDDLAPRKDSPVSRSGWENEEKLTVEQAWTILCETPDITSPEEYPDHALITMEQLGSFMARAVGNWHPIVGADKSINQIIGTEIGLPIGNSLPIWARDGDGRVFECLWADDGKRAYWWDIEGESPVDPVEFMPHPLAALSATATEGE